MPEPVELRIISAPSGAKLGECEFVDGVAHGVARTWTESGVLTLEAGMRAGDYHGEYSSFWPSGTIKERGKYVSGNRVGLYQWFYESGLLIKEHDYGDAA